MTKVNMVLVTKNPKPARYDKGFASRSIDYAMSKTADDPKCALATEYLAAAHLLAWDDERELFWVNHPNQGWQVAVWLMPNADTMKHVAGY